MGDSIVETFGKTSFNLVKYPKKEFFLSDFNLTVMCRLEKRFGNINALMTRLPAITKDMNMTEISELVYATLDRDARKSFPEIEDFTDNILMNDLPVLLGAFTTALSQSLPSKKKMTTSQQMNHQKIPPKVEK